MLSFVWVYDKKKKGHCKRIARTLTIRFDNLLPQNFEHRNTIYSNFNKKQSTYYGATNWPVIDYSFLGIILQISIMYLIHINNNAMPGAGS